MTEKRWRHNFPHYKSMGAFGCHDNHSFDPIYPNTECSLFPTPLMLHIKFDQHWPTDPIWAEFELKQEFMPVLLASEFDEDPIKNECASLKTPFFHYKYMEKFLDAQRHLTPKGVVRSGRNSNLFDILCLSSLPASLTKIGQK